MLFEDVLSTRDGAHAAELDLVDELVALAAVMKELRKTSNPDIVQLVRPKRADTSARVQHIWVETSFCGTFIVVLSTQPDQVERNSDFWASSETRLFGEFKRREHADRWARALQSCPIPRNTRRLQRKRVDSSEAPTILRCQ